MDWNHPPRTLALNAALDGFVVGGRPDYGYCVFRLPTTTVRVMEAVVDPGSQNPNTSVEIRVVPISR